MIETSQNSYHSISTDVRKKSQLPENITLFLYQKSRQKLKLLTVRCESWLSYEIRIIEFNFVTLILYNHDMVIKYNFQFWPDSLPEYIILEHLRTLSTFIVRYYSTILCSKIDVRIRQSQKSVKPSKITKLSSLDSYRRQAKKSP